MAIQWTVVYKISKGQNGIFIWCRHRYAVECKWPQNSNHSETPVPAAGVLATAVRCRRHYIYHNPYPPLPPSPTLVLVWCTWRHSPTRVSQCANKRQAMRGNKATLLLLTKHSDFIDNSYEYKLNKNSKTNLSKFSCRNTQWCLHEHDKPESIMAVNTSRPLWSRPQLESILWLRA